MSVAAAIALLLLGLTAAVGGLNAIRPSKTWWLVLTSWAAGWVTIELAPHLIFFSGLVAAGLIALGGLENEVGIAGLALLVIADAIGAVFTWRAVRSVQIARNAIAELDPDPEVPRYPRIQILLPFLMFRRRGVRHERGVVYARHGELPLKLDVYLPELAASEPRPAIVQVHGGGWVSGTRKEQGIPLLNHLAANGWVGFNINYRLSPLATWPDHAIDVKRAIAWVREHAEEYNVDPSFIALTGGSAGGHISAFVGLTSDDKSLQPGFEDADTSVAATVPFYGVYDMLDEDAIHLPIVQWVLERYVFKAFRSDDPDAFRDASPTHRVHAGAPPYLVIHGDSDSLTTVEDARHFVAALREASDSAVLYAEMRGGQHAFDLIPSLRTVPVIEAIERFLHTVRTRRDLPESVEAEVDDEMPDRVPLGA
ncbi:MAG: alpha/beta hydrolase fold domain-containing protein [Solirubrobacterales bacterium]